MGKSPKTCEKIRSNTVSASSSEMLFTLGRVGCYNSRKRLVLILGGSVIPGTKKIDTRTQLRLIKLCSLAEKV